MDTQPVIDNVITVDSVVLIVVVQIDDDNVFDVVNIVVDNFSIDDDNVVDSAVDVTDIVKSLKF